MRVAAILAACIIAVADSADAEPAPRVKQAKEPLARDSRGNPVIRAIYAPMPEYPFNMRLQRNQGNGRYVLLLRPDGTVSGVAVMQSAGVKDLDIAAAQALIKWRFPPPPKGLRGVGIPINFRLRSRYNGGGTILD